MSDGIYVALSGAVAQTSVLDVTATNLANASTDGYQRMRHVFREALAQAEGTNTFRSVTTASTCLDPTRGALRVTGRGLDVSLPQSAYLTVSTARGDRYTRAGSLRVDLQGSLRTSHGDLVASEDGRPLRTDLNDPTEATVTQSGEIWQGENMLGRLKVVTFPKPEELTPEGGTLLAANPRAGVPAISKGNLDVGSLEESNASVMTGMTELVTANRTFEAFQRAIATFQQADQKVTTTVPDADQ
jgi:flagellar basal-body rod protein FlgF